MIEFFYQTLAGIGYTHPLHAVATHVPVGMVIGAFLFALGAFVLRHSGLADTARHCILLALVALIPTALLGYMDWQHYYAGAWVFPIKMKMGLAVLLVVLLMSALSIGRKGERVSARLLLMYTLCLLNVTALGFFGGELVYGERTPMKPGATADVQAGAALFSKSCTSCHPGGGNSIKQNLPLKGAPQVSSFDTFLGYIRKPKARDGSPTIMPPFPAEKLSETEAKEIYDYIVKVLNKS